MTQDLSRWIETHAAFTPDKDAIRFEGTVLSYLELRKRVRATAALLRDGHAVGRGDRVAYLGLNTPEVLILLFACAQIGAMLLPLNWRLAPPEHAYMLANAEPKVLVADADHWDKAVDLIESGAPGRLLDLDALAAAEGTVEPTGGPDDPVLLVYTSGTTGRPKGAVLDQRALLCNALNSIHMHDLSGTDHVLNVLPMFHVGGLNIQTTPTIYVGGTVTLLRSFDPGATLKAIAEDRPSLLVLVPATIAAVIAHPDWAGTDLTCLRAMTTGSSIVPVSLLRAFQDRAVPPIQVYGLTESAPVAAYQRIEDADRTFGTTGRAGLHTEVRVVDDTGRDVEAGAPGELWLRGANVCREYWRDPAATAETFRDGWFRTGDVGIRDPDGLITIKDRKKDMVISGGENIYPAELERVIDGLEGISEATVIGRPDPRWGEVPVALVARAPGAVIDEAEILAAFEGKLARFKHPKAVLFLDALPRNAMGKIQKHELRRMLAEGAL